VQRTAGNQAVLALVGRAGVQVQRTPADNLALLQTVPTVAPHATATIEGSKGDDIRTVAEEHFVTGEKGTWHHIYPRNLLGAHVQNISRYFVATNTHTARITDSGTSHALMEQVASSISMAADGSKKRHAHYFWKKGNGYLGILSDRRTDDPGSLVEHAKPKSMGDAAYQLPRKWGKSLEQLSNTLGGLAGQTDLAAADARIAKEAGIAASLGLELDAPWPYRSVDIEGKDWVRQNPAHQWGAQVKNYKLVK